jgi:aminoglycoside N3'-acetyltransferase
MTNFVRRAINLLPKKCRPSHLANKLHARKLTIEKKLYRNSIDIEDLRRVLLSMGHWRGRAVYVQSSWNQFYNVKLKPRELIDMMLELAGPDGTLAMPTTPLVSNPLITLEVDDSPSATGLLTESLRRWPGAVRSIHLTSSVSAVGPLAQHLASEHHLDPYSWGPRSPFGKLIEADALLVLLGTTTMGFTPLHNLECVMRESVPAFMNVWGPLINYRWKRKNGDTGEHSFYSRLGRITPKRLVSHFDPTVYKVAKTSNLTIQALESGEGLKRAMELAKRNITIYSPL